MLITCVQICYRGRENLIHGLQNDGNKRYQGCSGSINTDVSGAQIKTEHNLVGLARHKTENIHGESYTAEGDHMPFQVNPGGGCRRSKCGRNRRPYSSNQQNHHQETACQLGKNVSPEPPVKGKQRHAECYRQGATNKISDHGTTGHLFESSQDLPEEVGENSHYHDQYEQW